MTNYDILRYHEPVLKDGRSRSCSIRDEAVQRALSLYKEDSTLAVDIETRGLGLLSYEVKVIIIATETHAVVLDAHDAKHREAARIALSRANLLLFHNSPFDVPPLIEIGAMDYGDIARVWDTLITARQGISSDRGGHGLADIEKRLLARGSVGTKDVFNKIAKVHKWNKSEVYDKLQYGDIPYMHYSGWDGIVTRMAYPLLLDLAFRQYTNHPFGIYGADGEQALRLIYREQQVNRVFLRRAVRGLQVDMDAFGAERERVRQDQLSSYSILVEDYQMRSPSNRNDLAAVLEDHVPSDYPKTPTGNLSTKAEHLLTLDHPAAHAFIDYDQKRRLDGYLATSYDIAATNNGLLRPRVSIHAAITGRSSVSEPPYQQFIPAAREMIEEDGPGIGMTSLDWSQQEPVILAYLAGDTAAIEAYEHSGDFYTTVASGAGVGRYQAKQTTLAQLYGQGIRALSAKLALDESDGADLRARVALGAPASFRVALWAHEWARETGKTFTLDGRIIDVPTDLPYKGANFLVQGSAYDMMADTITAVDDAGLDEAIYLSMHDELVTHDDAAAEIQTLMSTPTERFAYLAGRTPALKVDAAKLGDRWRTPKDD